jgi:hypothetical protein
MHPYKIEAIPKSRYTNIAPKLWKVLITQEVAAIPPEMTRRVVEKYRGRGSFSVLTMKAAT